jgi:hypothetical protein
MTVAMRRRDFLYQTTLAAGLGPTASAAEPGVSILLPPDDPVVAAPPVRWAAQEVQDTLASRRVPARIIPALDQAPAADFCIVVTSAGAPAGPEALALRPEKRDSRSVLTAAGSDPRGLVYALLELADRAAHADDPRAALALRAAVTERPANVIRSVTRCFVSNVEDKPWFHDRSMWPAYLTMLATQRFNRFSLAFGIGYDFTRQIRDCYLHFAYPFLLGVPGYQVRAVPLADEERDRNLEMVRYISEQTAARGLQFQLALWTHAWQWTESPQANYTIQGLNADNHAGYCRDALYHLLQACPAVSGVTFRVHGESGIAEGSHQFWKTVFDGILRTGRRIEIDMHAKGMDQGMIDVALSTGLPVNISPKYWAEHMGLPYHQAAIRELELPRKADGFFALSSGERRFLRYGYGDLLREDRRYGVLHRIWPGTQRLLLWGNPAIAGAYGRASSFCGSMGVEICEPLSFKGRKGSGLPGGRTAYADPALAPRYDWEKYLYTYRLWGRLLYNPDADPDTWRRQLRAQFHDAAGAAETALAQASRILPLVTTAHLPSAANNSFWPENYTNMPMVDAGRRHPYGDTPSPRRFGAVSPLDPQLFSRIDEFAAELAQGALSGKYSPLEVAQWLEEAATAAEQHLGQAEKQMAGRAGAEWRRLSADVAIQSGLGYFYAHKLRAGVLYALYERTQHRLALEEAVKSYRAAREAWVKLAKLAAGVYRPDITFGYDQHLRGHWSDRLPAIDQDLADLEKLLPQASGNGSDAIIRRALVRPGRPTVEVHHTPAPSSRPGQPLVLELSTSQPVAARLHYRHVHQAESWQAADMEARDDRHRAAIPGAYTESFYALQYYFELRTGPDSAWLYPGFRADFANQPYFVVRRS